MTSLAKFSGNEAKYVLEFLESGGKGSKSWNQRLEEAFAEKMGVKYAVACNSGTSGLHAAVIAAGVEPGDEVISPALTVVMDAFAVVHAGGTPIFADINPKTQTVDPEDVRRKITPQTKAIIVVSLQGLAADMDPIMSLAKEHGILVIEDSAQTMLGTYKGNMAGTLGDIGVFSFENKKHMTSGSEGGMIVSNDAGLATAARKFAGIGYKHMTARAGRTSLAMSEVQDPDYERFDTLGLNYRMSEVSAAVGLAQFEKISELVSRRQAVAKIFEACTDDCDWLTAQEVPADYVHSYYTYSMIYDGNEQKNVSWKEFYNTYLELGGDGFYGACMIPYLEPVFKDQVVNGVQLGEGLCPIAEALQPKIMQFKTNYRDLDLAQTKASILRKTIDRFN